MLEEWSCAKLKWTWEYTITIWYDCSTVTQPEPSLYDGGRAAPVKVYEDLYYDIKKTPETIQVSQCFKSQLILRSYR